MGHQSKSLRLKACAAEVISQQNAYVGITSDIYKNTHARAPTSDLPSQNLCILHKLPK